MAAETNSNYPAGAEIYRLVVDAKKCIPDNRTDNRMPFFRPASLDLGDGHQYSAFTRDISAIGVGLIHSTAFVPSDISVRILSDEGRWVRVRTRISWCKSCGEGWYMSGGVFIGTAVVD